MNGRRLRYALFSITLAALLPLSAHAQYANKTGNVVGTIGGTCNSSNNDYGWPDTNGNILKCVSNVWTLQGVAATAAGSTGDVQFNNGGALAGSNNLFWNNSSGYLGIGTTVPNYPLTIYSTASPGSTQVTGTYMLTLNNNAGWGSPSILFQETYDNVASIEVLDMTGGVNDMAFKIATSDSSGTLSEKMRLKASGNLGIGTTTPAAKLHVYDTSGANGALDNVLWLTGGGSGVAGGPPVVFNDYYGNGSYPTWQLAQVGAAFGGNSWDGDLHILLNTGSNATSTSEVMTLKGHTGNVGIGTTVPGATLTVGNNAFGVTSGGAVTDTGETVNGNATVSGNVGIGTTVTGATLDVFGATTRLIRRYSRPQMAATMAAMAVFSLAMPVAAKMLKFYFLMRVQIPSTFIQTTIVRRTKLPFHRGHQLQ
jgi:hypothetical protein